MSPSRRLYRYVEEDMRFRTNTNIQIIKQSKN